MIKRALLTLLVVFALAPTTYAYSPPPGGLLPLLLTSSKSSIVIELPPKLIMTPSQLRFSNVSPSKEAIYNFAGGKFERQSGQGSDYNSYKVNTSTKESGSAGEYYVITITGFTKGEVPSTRDIRLTFQPQVNKNAIDRVEGYLKNNSIPTARLSGSDCDTLRNEKSYICLDTATTASSGTKRATAHLVQTIGVTGTFVPGNVAAPGTISGFSLGKNSIAVGGTVNISGGTHLPTYLSDETVSFRWSNVSGEIGTMLNRGLTVGTSVNSTAYNSSSHKYSGDHWYLNAFAKDPTVGNFTSFSTPPEGKIWKTDGPLTLDGDATYFSHILGYLSLFVRQ